MKTKPNQGMSALNYNEMSRYYDKFMTEKEQDSIKDIFDNLFPVDNFDTDKERQQAFFNFSSGFLAAHMIYTGNIE